ncbi:hypothetical protein AWH48_11975 [Domibacillus aminovorans]|uniref:Translation initiation factor beta propellor-like domain-containing protein n=1 Tax=Domibacillus aminovorans TaxID=29332 RepID=A0A177KI77_9BACI|nr:WD40 repeat domain-containing protein [Domibacillus aminovorans]OAH53069.1 hypothetical protein AWH48_11975 [Domibacillus aminovorans]
MIEISEHGGIFGGSKKINLETSEVYEFGETIAANDTVEVRRTLDNFTTHGSTPGVDISCIAVSPDGVYVAFGSTSASGGYRLFMYKRQPNGDLYKLPSASIPHTGTVYTVAWSPDGNHLFVGGTTQSLYRRMGDDTFMLLADLPGMPTTYIYEAAYSPDGTMLALAGSSSTGPLHIYSISGETYTKQTAPAPGDAGMTLAWSPDSQHLAFTKSTPRYLIIYKRVGNTVEFLTDMNTSGASSYKRSLQYSPDGSVLTMAGSSTFPFVFKRTGDTYTVLDPLDTYDKNNARFAPYTIRWTPDGKYMYVAGIHSDNKVDAYRYSNGKFYLMPPPVLKYGVSVNQMDFSPTGDYLYTGLQASPYSVMAKRPVKAFKANGRQNRVAEVEAQGYAMLGGNVGDTKKIITLFK